MKTCRSIIGICLLHNFNRDDAKNPYQGMHVGEELDVVIKSANPAGFLELVPVPSEQSKGSGPKGRHVELTEGARVTGQVLSIKNMQLFVRIPASTPTYGRLHQIECESLADFNKYSKGDSVEVKVLKPPTQRGESKGAVWAELTRKPVHMKCKDGLDSSEKTRSLLMLKDLKVGQRLEGTLVLG